MVITAVYYTKYSETLPIDPTMARDEVCFEVAEVSGDIKNIAFRLLTPFDPSTAVTMG